MIKVRSKEHSIELIEKLRLNSMPQAVLNKENKESIVKFFEKHPATEYVIRDIFTPMGKYKFVKDLNECLEYVDSLSANKFSISVSFRPIEGRILLGDIMVSNNFVTLSASKSQTANHRNIYDSPEISLNCDLYDDKVWDVPGFDKLINYINKFNLFDIVVEFAIFRTKVGKKKDNVVIIELRSDY